MTQRPDYGLAFQSVDLSPELKRLFTAAFNDICDRIDRLSHDGEPHGKDYHDALDALENKMGDAVERRLKEEMQKVSDEMKRIAEETGDTMKQLEERVSKKPDIGEALKDVGTLDENDGLPAVIVTLNRLISGLKNGKTNKRKTK